MLDHDHDSDDDSLVCWALRYAGYGWSVVPVHSVRAGRCTCGRRRCPSVAKHPRIRWEHAMSEPASPAQLAAWCRRWPEANIGIVTGAVSGVAVLDVDPRNGGDVTLRELEDWWGVLPVSPQVHTGGGGRHLWFGVDESLPSGELGPGLDLKGDGGMVVAPPSMHASGRRYLWRPGGRPDDVPLPPTPDWVVHLGRGGAVQEPGREPTPLRTSAEQADFGAAWSRAGIDLLQGDRYYLCPFHNDHQPSLHIDAERCRWFCFGCAVGGGIGRLHQLLGEHQAVRPRSRLKQIEGRPLPVTLHGRHQADVVGESHYQDALLELTGGRRRYGGVDVDAVAQLVPDPDNPYDSDAVEVRIQDRVVGHVRRHDLEWLRPAIDESLDLHNLATCRAMIRGGWDRGRGSVGWFGVVLLLPDPADDPQTC